MMKEKWDAYNVKEIKFLNKHKLRFTTSQLNLIIKKVRATNAKRKTRNEHNKLLIYQYVNQ